MNNITREFIQEFRETEKKAIEKGERSPEAEKHISALLSEYEKRLFFGESVSTDEAMFALAKLAYNDFHGIEVPNGKTRDEYLDEILKDFEDGANEQTFSEDDDSEEAQISRAVKEFMEGK